MPSSKFLDVYLREIGVKTPVSLLFCAPDTLPSSDMPEADDELVIAKDLLTLKAQALACEQCDLSSTRSKIIVGSGDDHADVLWIADVPHAEDNVQGNIFTGDSALLLDNILKAMGLLREQVYITPIIQCDTPDHRDPNADEWAACQSWLQQKINLVQPKLILLMGRVAAQTLLQSHDALHDLRGQWHGYQDIPTRAIYHPAYLLRSPRQKQGMWQDIQAIQEKLSLL